MRALREEGHRFSFFQAVRLLQHALPEGVPVGGPGPASRERLRLRPALDLAFAPSDVASIRSAEAPDGSPRFEVEVTFLGLYGAASPLPTYFTEELLHQEEGGLARGLLDLFHHRILSLFYRAWEKYRLAARFREDGGDPIGRLLRILASADRWPEGRRVRAVRLLGPIGILTRPARSAGAIAGLLEDYFEGISFAVEPCVPRRVPIPPGQRTRLGQAAARLGKDTLLGDRVTDRSGTFRIRLSALRLADLLDFLPGGGRLKELEELLDRVDADGLDCEIELELRREETPELRLSSGTARLGWLTWLGGPPGANPRIRFLRKGWAHG